MPSVRLLLLLLLPLSTVVVTAQTIHNVSLGSSLSTNDENPSWISPSGEFSFGFYRLPDGDRFLLAIWFDKIPEKTVVWSANGDEPVQGGSKVELTTDGRLILSDAQDEEIWKAESTSGSVASAAMLDTGNFVLWRMDSVIVWESFNVPTDTILPSQILGLGSQLSSHLTRKDYSKGRFQLHVQADGNLVFCPVNLPTESRYSAYWASNTVDSGYQLIFNTSGYIYFTQRNGSMFNLSSENGKMVSTKDFYHRATLDFDGVFRQYISPKNHSSSGNWAGSWSVVWYEPRNLCTAIRSEFGSGACGFNSYCKLDDDQRPSCECPPGYSYLDPNNTFGGCKQDFVPQSCDSGAERLFELREMTSTDWPLSDFERYNPINEDQCRQTCLSDCFCAVAIFRDGNCWKKKLPLSNGKMDPSVGGKALIKVSRGNFTSRPLPPPSTGTEKGSGACGFNSYYKQLDENQKPSCECPPGYSFFDPNNKSGGCKQDFIPQSCEAYGSKEADQFEMRELDNADWPRSDFEQYYPINISKCKEACLGDCLCAVSIFIDGFCWKKKLPLSNGKMYEGINRVALIKVRKRNSTSLAPPPPPDSATGKRRNPKNLILILSLILGGFVFLFLSAISSVVFCSFRKKRSIIQPDSMTMFTTNLRSFTYSELHEITDGFKEELGSGGFGTVCKGVFASEYGNFIAVKKLNSMETEAEKGFETEVKTIGRTHHKNLVQLIGFCNEGPHRLLVFEYMSNGSLARFLFGSSKPDWNLRKKIAKGIARGLSYLHEECRTQIIHCDIKPQNILLDDCLTAKISDFGISKLLKTDQTRTRTGIRGTKGYLAPEWFKTRAVTVKVDVYSFGVVLLEIICCRKNIQLEIGNEEEMILTDWACDCYKERRLDLLVEEEEEALKDGMWLERLVMVAIWCIQEDPCMRPSMNRVTQMLDGSVEVNDPPDPSPYVRSLG